MLLDFLFIFIFFCVWTGLYQVLKYNSECLNQCKGDFDGKSHFQIAKLFCIIWWFSKSVWHCAREESVLFLHAGIDNWLKKLYTELSAYFGLHPSIFCEYNEKNLFYKDHMKFTKLFIQVRTNPNFLSKKKEISIYSRLCLHKCMCIVLTFLKMQT